MNSSGSDFDAAKAVADQLEGLEKERQQRILRWVAESLSLDIGIHPDTERRTGETDTWTDHGATAQRDARSPLSQQRFTDIKTFVDSKRPKSDVQFAAVVAFFYRFEAGAESRKDSIDAETLQNAARLAARRRPPKALMTLNNAKNQGYLDSPERGQFCINSVGENLVAMALPGSEPERTRKKPKSTKSARVKAKAKKSRKVKATAKKR